MEALVKYISGMPDYLTVILAIVIILLSGGMFCVLEWLNEDKERIGILFGYLSLFFVVLILIAFVLFLIAMAIKVIIYFVNM
jgi:hypothetical protein